MTVIGCFRQESKLIPLIAVLLSKVASCMVHGKQKAASAYVVLLCCCFKKSSIFHLFLVKKVMQSAASYQKLLMQCCMYMMWVFSTENSSDNVKRGVFVYLNSKWYESKKLKNNTFESKVFCLFFQSLPVCFS